MVVFCLMRTGRATASVGNNSKKDFHFESREPTSLSVSGHSA